jgi:hypothetical protein
MSALSSLVLYRVEISDALLRGLAAPSGFAKATLTE